MYGLLLNRAVHYGEHHLRPETGYHQDIPCAKDVYIRDGTTMHASLAEQLTVLPAVTVAAMSMGNSAKVILLLYYD
jgi:hypothetical protein